MTLLSKCNLRGTRMIAAVIAIACYSAAMLRAGCGSNNFFPTNKVVIQAESGSCTGIWNVSTQKYVCGASLTDPCTGSYMTGPGNCECLGTGSACDQSFIGPPNPVTVDYDVYGANTNCKTNNTNNGCICIYSLMSVSEQTIADCMLCPSA